MPRWMWVPVERKVRKIRNSLMVAIPTQVAALAGIEAGDTAAFDYLDRGVLRIERVGGPHSIPYLAYSDEPEASYTFPYE